MKTENDIESFDGPIGMICSKNRVHLVKIKSLIYNDFLLTSKGIFKFKVLGYYGKSKIYWTEAILPRDQK